MNWNAKSAAVVPKFQPPPPFKTNKVDENDASMTFHHQRGTAMKYSDDDMDAASLAVRNGQVPSSYTGGYKVIKLIAIVFFTDTCCCRIFPIPTNTVRKTGFIHYLSN